MDRKVWEEQTQHEIGFWEEWLKNKGGVEYEGEYKKRTDPNLCLQKLISRFVNQKSPENKILDVGAGALTVIGKKHHLTKINILAVDPLADRYDLLLEKYGVVPLVRTQKCDGEELSQRFRENSFDIVYSRNALDHAYNPLRCIEEMIKVAKESHYIIIQVFEREGSRAQWAGLHQWDFSIKRTLRHPFGHLVFQDRKSDAVDINNCLRGRVEKVLLTKKGAEISVVFKKRR